ncbi:hypothetical protein KKA14_21285 [bacterium]|nr:hypothetical protein [bacterium]
MNAKAFWKISMISVIGLWILTLVAGYYLYPGSHLDAWRFFIALLIVHASELFISYKIGKGKNLSTQTIVIKTLIFGFTWWVPVKKGIIEE